MAENKIFISEDTSLISVTQENVNVTVNEDGLNIVDVKSPGPQGPQGIQGPPGPDTFPFTGSAIISGSLIVTGSIFPGGDNVFDLGSSTNRFKDIYVSNNSIFLGDLILRRDPNGNLNLIDSASQELKIINGIDFLSGSLEVENNLIVNQSITGSDVSIDLWGSISASLASISASAATVPNLQQVTDQGATTGNDIVISGSLNVTETLTAREFHTEYVSASIIYESGSTKFGDTSDDIHEFTGSVDITGSLLLNGSPVGAGASIEYVTGSNQLDLSQIEVLDFDDNVAVSFVGGKLQFTFGEPTEPSSISFTLSGFATNRFSQITDSYSVVSSWNNEGYTLVSASILEDSILLASASSGTSLNFDTTTSGSHTYTFNYTASSPLDGSLFTSTTSVTGTLSKTQPGNPSLSTTPTVQLGASSNQIEQGATGSISFSAAYGSLNDWEQVSLVTSPSSSPVFVTGSATGSTSIVISATASYQSPAGENTPQLSTTKLNSTTFTKIRSLRHGSSTSSSFSQAELEDIDIWDTTLGGSIGTIEKGDTNPSGNSITITWSGDKYHYIVYDSNRSDLTNITTSGFGVLGQFTKTTSGDYTVYRTTTLQAGGSGTSITYILT